MTGSALTKEIQNIIVNSGDIQDKSQNLLGDKLYVYRNIDFSTISGEDIKSPHCSIIFGGKDNRIKDCDYSVYIGFSSTLIGNTVEEKTTYDNTDIAIEEVIKSVVYTISVELETGIGNETGFEITSTHTEPFVQRGQKDSAFILEIEIHQIKSC